MDHEEKVMLARKGNEAFNNGKINEAIKYFVKAGYRDGIMRVADYYYYDNRQPLVALKFYKMINRKDRIDEIFARMMFALGKLLRPSTEKDSDYERDKNSSDDEVEVKIHPKLKILAEEIIRKNEKEK
ncbi:MAG: hypothetical protein FWH53_02365 [Leptospirales bacterium]|nr:hypothetical protein [Leptospirales bacterium]